MEYWLLHTWKGLHVGGRERDGHSRNSRHRALTDREREIRWNVSAIRRENGSVISGVEVGLAASCFTVMLVKLCQERYKLRECLTQIVADHLQFVASCLNNGCQRYQNHGLRCNTRGFPCAGQADRFVTMIYFVIIKRKFKILGLHHRSPWSGLLISHRFNVLIYWAIDFIDSLL